MSSPVVGFSRSPARSPSSALKISLGPKVPEYILDALSPSVARTVSPQLNSVSTSPYGFPINCSSPEVSTDSTPLPSSSPSPMPTLHKFVPQFLGYFPVSPSPSPTPEPQSPAPSSPNKIIYQGTFKEGRFQGVCKLHFSSGASFLGNFQEGKTPTGKLQLEDGTLLIGNFLENPIKSKGITVQKGGLIHCGKFYDGELKQGFIFNANNSSLEIIGDYADKKSCLEKNQRAFEKAFERYTQLSKNPHAQSLNSYLQNLPG